MAQEENIITKLKNQGYSKQEIDSALHKAMLYIIQQNKQHQISTLPTKSFSKKFIQHVQSLTGKALCLLKTLFAKKPKNPI